MSGDINKFTLLWRITNFKTLVKTGYKWFESPPFVANYSDGTMWALHLRDVDDQCQLGVECSEKGKRDTRNYYNFNFTIICNDKENISNDLRNGFCKGHLSWLHFSSVSLPINLKDILRNAKKFLNGKCLTLLFSMWKNNGDVFDLIQLTADTEHFRNYIYRDCEYSFAWTVEDFGQKAVVEKIIYVALLKYLLKLSILDDESIEVVIKNISSCEKEFKACCEVVSSSLGKQNENLELQDLLCCKNAKVFCFPSYLSKNKFSAIKRDFVSKGVLQLHFKLTFKVEEKKKSFVSYEFFSSNKFDVGTNIESECSKTSMNYFSNSNFENLTSKLEEMYASKKFTDVVLEVDGKFIKAHRGVLANMLPKCLEIFEEDMLQGKSGTIVIKDIDYETLDDMIYFMYCAQIKDINYQKTKNLIISAKKYGVDSLKVQCCLFLKSCLTLETVCEILLLSDMICDEKLQDSAIDFFASNSKNILITEEWKKLKKSNCKLAVNTLEKLILNS